MRLRRARSSLRSVREASRKLHDWGRGWNAELDKLKSKIERAVQREIRAGRGLTPEERMKVVEAFIDGYSSRARHAAWRPVQQDLAGLDVSAAKLSNDERKHHHRAQRVLLRLAEVIDRRNLAMQALMAYALPPRAQMRKANPYRDEYERRERQRP